MSKKNLFLLFIFTSPCNHTAHTRVVAAGYPVFNPMNPGPYFTATFDLPNPSPGVNFLPVPTRIHRFKYQPKIIAKLVFYRDLDAEIWAEVFCRWSLPWLLPHIAFCHLQINVSKPILYAFKLSGLLTQFYTFNLNPSWPVVWRLPTKPFLSW